MADFEHIAYDVLDGVATITLNRPERLNAFTSTMGREIVEAFDLTDGDDDVRAVIITGSGRAFCAGADLSKGGKTFDFRAADDEGAARRDGGGRVTLRVFESLKPVIGAINGPAVGFGATFTLPMDIRLASENARVGFVFSRRGVVPEAASTWFLPRIVGISQSLEWMMTGRVFNAQEALAGGLVSAVLPANQLIAHARELATEISQHTSPVSVALVRRMLWRGVVVDHPMDVHRIDSRGMAARGRSADAYEGVASFLEKRAPSFSDKVSEGLPDIFPDWEEPEFS